MRASRWRSDIRRVASKALIAGLAGLVLLAAHSGESLAAGGGSRDATGAFLAATLELDRTMLANQGESRVRARTYALTLEHQCPRVVASAPLRSLDEVQTEGKPGAHARGELSRRENQLFDVRVQLADALVAAALAPDHDAVVAYERAVTPLHWRDPELNSLVEHELAALVYLEESPTGEVCASLRSWAASGYETVDTTTRQAGARFVDLVDNSFSYDLARPQTLEALLERHETASQRALMRRVEILTTRLPNTDDSHADSKAATTLGFVEEPEHAQRGRVIGHGLTAAGISYVIRVERTPIVGCRFATNVESSSAAGLVPYATIESTSSGPSLGCPLNGGRAKPRVTCEQGVVAIVYRTPAAAREATLRMSDGSSYTSAVALLPQRLGGPAGVYYQAVRGTTLRPISLTLLNGRGQAISVVRLPHSDRCSPSATQPPTTLAVVKGPDGASFQIRGELGALRGHHTFSFEAVDGALGGDPLLFDTAPSGGQIGSGALRWRLATGCEPTDTLLYGLLATPGDHVLARTSEGLQPLTAVAIPPRLHASGELVYGTFPTLPTEIVLQAPDGSALATVDLATQVGEAAEYCSGYDEPTTG